jgi:hypothetical protein
MLELHGVSWNCTPCKSNLLTKAGQSRETVGEVHLDRIINLEDFVLSTDRATAEKDELEVFKGVKNIVRVTSRTWSDKMP